MTYQELKNQDYGYKSYAYFVSMLAIQNKQPIDIVRIDNADKTSLFVILLESSKGVINTKRIRLSGTDVAFFTSYIANDFPEVDFRHIDRQLKED